MKSQEFEQLRSSKGEKAAFISPQQTRAINARIDNLAGDGMLEEDSRRSKHAKGTVHPLRSADAFPTTGAQPAPCPLRQQHSPLTRAISQSGEDVTRDLPAPHRDLGASALRSRLSNPHSTVHSWQKRTSKRKKYARRRTKKAVLVLRVGKESWMT